MIKYVDRQNVIKFQLENIDSVNLIMFASSIVKYHPQMYFNVAIKSIFVNVIVQLIRSLKM